MSCKIQDFDVEKFKSWLKDTFVGAFSQNLKEQSVIRSFFDDIENEGNVVTRELSVIDEILGVPLEYSGIFPGCVIFNNPPRSLTDKFEQIMVKNGFSASVINKGDIRSVSVKIGKPVVVLLRY